MFFLLFFLFLSLCILFYAVKYGIGPVFSRKEAREKFENLIVKQNGKKVVDLGSGWGQLCFYIAKNHPEVTVIGYEISFIPYLFSKLFFRKKNLFFYRKDFYKINLESFDGVFCYLYPDAMEKLKEKFQKELSKKASIVSYVFRIPNSKEEISWTLKDLYQSKIYYYSKDSLSDRQS